MLDLDDHCLEVSAPLFLLIANQSCSLCGTENPVIAIASQHLKSSDEHEFEGLEDDGFLLSNVAELPEQLLSLVLERHENYECRHSRTADETYYMSTCGCGGHYGDFYVHKNISDLAFREPEKLDIQKLPVTGTWKIACGYSSSYSLGYILDKQVNAP